MQRERSAANQRKAVALGVPVSDRTSPLVGQTNPMYGDGKGFVAVPTTWAVVLQQVLLLAWLICLWTLPGSVGFFKEHTGHTVMLHCVATALILVLAVYVQGVHKKVLLAGYLSFHRKTSLRHMTLVIVCIVNVALLALVCMGNNFSSNTTAQQEELTGHALLCIRIVAVVEFIFSASIAAVYLYRVRKHNVAQPLPEARKNSSVNGYQPPGLDQTAASAASASGYNQQRANEVIAYLQQREDDLVFQVNNLTQQLEAQTSRPVQGGGDVEAGRPGGPPQGREVAGQLQAAQDQLSWHEQELRKATSEAQRLRTALREERRKNEKLQLTLEIEKEANAQAQRVIEGIRNLDASDLSDAGARTSDFGGGYSPPNTSGFSGRPPRP